MPFLSMTEASVPPRLAAPLRALLWLALAVLAGSVLAAVFFAYGRPEFLLELLNLRYCG
jgi:hypothetical protein